jgi:hypothetical protein
MTIVWAGTARAGGSSATTPLPELVALEPSSLRNG